MKLNGLLIVACGAITGTSALMQAEPRPDYFSQQTQTYQTFNGNYDDPMHHGRVVPDPAMAYTMPGFRTSVTGERTSDLPIPKAETGFEFKTAGYDTYNYADPAFCRTLPGRADPATQIPEGTQFLPKARVVTGIEGYNPYLNNQPDIGMCRTMPHSGLRQQ